MSEATQQATEARRTELATALASVRDRISGACESAGRDPAETTLVVVTKFFPASDVLLLHELGVRAIGENKDQEAGAKIAAVRAALRGDAGLELHFVGRLQSNKARHVAGYADVVHSVDRVKLLRGLSAGAMERGRPLSVLIQVSLDGDTGRGGALPADVPRLAAAVVDRAGLVLKGVMAVAPMEADSDDSFALLREVASGIRAVHPGADWVSAGMSGDLEAAIRHGATHLRVGTAILGSRPSLL
ncbi:MAG TPA: YggS family pyridoxal phosphate-dependent enzyme [Intrasporangium sp.]|uniref:YggS family pyridoxal phosphate-dependent enzyme n=1 Tax=Intrasporangium sp. TaxID=1925024 RepID=UPI002B49E08C|nr:YggS family pyridoxal phosphate-dependent enzyme [Intrasporangium sp.]HKX66968.1 YggS family pyridoxal phosphate-dependent enzyme [Intrasporangium sp.]